MTTRVSGAGAGFSQIGKNSYVFRGTASADRIIIDPADNMNGILLNTFDFNARSFALINQTETDFDDGIHFCGATSSLGSGDGGFKVSRQNIFLPPGHGLVARSGSGSGHLFNISITYEVF